MMNLDTLDPLIKAIQNWDKDVGACFYPDRDIFILYKDGIIVYKIDFNRPDLLTLPIDWHIREAKKMIRVMKTVDRSTLDAIRKNPLVIGKKL